MQKKYCNMNLVFSFPFYVPIFLLVVSKIICSIENVLSISYHSTELYKIGNTRQLTLPSPNLQSHDSKKDHTHKKSYSYVQSMHSFSQTHGFYCMCFHKKNNGWSLTKWIDMNAKSIWRPRTNTLWTSMRIWKNNAK